MSREPDAAPASGQGLLVEDGPVGVPGEAGGHVEGHREHRLAVGLVEAREGAPGVGRLELRGGQGVLDAVVVGEHGPVEPVELVVQDARELEEDRSRPGSERRRRRQRQALGRLVDLHAQFEGVRPGTLQARRADVELRRVQGDLGALFDDLDVDAHLAREGRRAQVRGEAQRVAARFDAVGQAVTGGGVDTAGR